jgi:hypothetical protein
MMACAHTNSMQTTSSLSQAFQAAVPQAAVPQAAVPQAAVPQAAVPQAAVPQAALFQTLAPRAAVVLLTLAAVACGGISEATTSAEPVAGASATEGATGGATEGASSNADPPSGKPNGTSPSATTSATPQDGAPAKPHACRDALYENAAMQPGTKVVACDLPPNSQLIAVSGNTAYTLTPQGYLFAHDMLDGSKRQVYHAGRHVSDPLRETQPSYHQGSLYFRGLYIQGNFGQPSLLRVPSDKATSAGDAKAVSAWGEPYEISGRSLTDGAMRFSGSTKHQGFSAYAGPVIAIDQPSGAVKPLTSHYGSPVALSKAWVYYCHDNEMWRTRRDGSAQEFVTREKPRDFCAATLLAADDQGVYFTPDAAKNEVWHYTPSGANTRIVELKGDAEIPPGEPSNLQVDRDSLYFNVGEGTLQRVALDGSSHSYPLVGGAASGPAIVTEQEIFVAVKRDGLQAGVDTVIVRVTKPLVAEK